MGIDLVLGKMPVGHNRRKEGAKARFCITNNASAPGESRQGRGPLIAMQVDNQIKLLPAQAADEFQQVPEIIVLPLLVQEKAGIQMRIVLYYVSQLPVRQQGQPGLGVGGPQGAEHRGHKQQIA